MTIKVDYSLLQKKDLFFSKFKIIQVLKSLDHSTIQRIGHYVQEQHFNQGQCVIRHLSEDKNVYFLLSGCLKVSITSSNGKEIDFKIIAPGAMLGELSAIDNQRRSASVSAIEPSFTAMLNQADFLILLKTEPGFSFAVMAQMTSMIRRLSEKVFEFGTMSIAERVYLELIRMARSCKSENNETEIQPFPTHHEIANMIGANREAVNRVLNHLKKLDIIKIQKHRSIIITDVALLKSMVERVGIQ